MEKPKIDVRNFCHCGKIVGQIKCHEINGKLKAEGVCKKHGKVELTAEYID